MPSDAIRDLRPPDWPMRFVNPLIKWELRSPVARWLPWAQLSFDGRRSGKRLEVVVRMYILARSGELVTFTPNPWRANFVEPRDVDVRYRGQVTCRVGTLVRDFDETAEVLNQLVDQGLWVPGGLRVSRGARFSGPAVAATNTMLLRLS